MQNRTHQKKQTTSRKATSKRTAQARSTTRSVVGSGGLKRLQFSRAQVLVVVLLVALVGGFLVYRGRAANAILSVPGAEGETQECTSGSGVIAKETAGSKRNGLVCEL
ncbi:hypothetical protein E6P97_01295 [Patescibacteria group bacterium]|nr:MAG: hypothetical protein E6P97_01295 [Patescibacteria group bacterium]